VILGSTSFVILGSTCQLYTVAINSQACKSMGIVYLRGPKFVIGKFIVCIMGRK
jgi:hypothetical protein